MNTESIAIIGGGNMGSSLIGGLIANHYPVDKLCITDSDLQKLKHLEHRFGVHTTNNNLEAVKAADCVILAVKPQIMASLIAELLPAITARQPLVISIAAGLRESSLSHWLGKKTPIVRVMPNTPALIGCGASALYANQYVSAAQKNMAESILRAVGLVVWIEEEKLMDLVTAISGSGPAYFFLMMEILQQTAEAQGMPKEMARLLTLQTAFGAARMALESEHPTSLLREQVTSKGGTTEAALNVFRTANIDQIIKNAVLAAEKRSEELATTLDKGIN